MVLQMLKVHHPVGRKVRCPVGRKVRCPVRRKIRCPVGMKVRCPVRRKIRCPAGRKVRHPVGRKHRCQLWITLAVVAEHMKRTITEILTKLNDILSGGMHFNCHASTNGQALNCFLCQSPLSSVMRIIFGELFKLTSA